MRHRGLLAVGAARGGPPCGLIEAASSALLLQVYCWRIRAPSESACLTNSCGNVWHPVLWSPAALGTVPPGAWLGDSKVPRVAGSAAGEGCLSMGIACESSIHTSTATARCTTTRVAKRVSGLRKLRGTRRH